MGIIKINKYKFAFDFYETRRIYPFYTNVFNKTNGKNYFNNEINKTSDLANVVHFVNYINPYYDLILDKKRTHLNVIKLHQDKGFMAKLNEFTSIDAYMNSKMSSKSRTKMRGYVRRLETCFNITYKIYHGHIPKNDYDFLFSKFKSFLTRRFTQRGDKHEALDRWDIIKDDTFDMIMNKTASLFVIYNDNEPIDICLNYHHQNIIDNAIRSYDIDYSKFRLGYVDIYKQLEWCFQNSVDIFDLSIGDFAYKRTWCNVVYDFEHHIVYDKNSFVGKISAYLIRNLYNTKAYLKKKNVHLFYHKIRNFFKPKVKVDEAKSEPVLEISEIDAIPVNVDTKQINYLLDRYGYIRKPIYDFQYLNSDESKNIQVYTIDNQNGTFFVKGQKKALKIKLMH